jgi:hypothetical protein
MARAVIGSESEVGGANAPRAFVSSQTMPDGRIRFRLRMRAHGRRLSLGMFDTREEADAARASAKVPPRSSGFVSEAKTKHRNEVHALKREGWKTRGFNEEVRRRFAAELVLAQPCVPDAFRLRRGSIEVAEVEVSHAGAEKWEPFARACAGRGIRFIVLVVDRYGSRTTPFPWAR